MDHAHLNAEPSSWVVRFARLVPSGGRVLDLACGSGRHARFFASLGCEVEAVDRDAASLASLEGLARIHTRNYDLEAGEWPYADQEFDAIVVTNYLHRPLFPHLFASLKVTGVLICETFMLGNERFGRPSNPAFLLRQDELIELVRGCLDIIAFEQGTIEAPKPASVQRLAAVKPGFARPRLL
jgi:SAM-dependent methyltransferase